MPDLGKFANAVLGSYAISILLVVVIVAMSLWRSKRVAAELDKVEDELGRKSKA